MTELTDQLWDRYGELVFDDTPEGRWMAELAGRLFGPRGPTVGIR